MRELPLILTDRDGRVRGANHAGWTALGTRCSGTCAGLVDARRADGTGVCAHCTPADIPRGAQIDHGEVEVLGEPVRLVCSAVDGLNVVAFMPPLPAPGHAATLTPREREVLRQIARGFTTRAIATRLGVSEATVRCHAEHIRRKLGVHTRSQAVARALSTGEIE